MIAIEGGQLGHEEKEERRPPIYELLALVAAEVGAVGRDSMNEEQRFRYRSIDAVRVTRRWVLVKCCDYVDGKRLVVGPVMVADMAATMPVYTHDLVILDRRGVGPGGWNMRTITRTARGHSYLVVLARSSVIAHA